MRHCRLTYERICYIIDQMYQLLYQIPLLSSNDMAGLIEGVTKNDVDLILYSSSCPNYKEVISFRNAYKNQLSEGSLFNNVIYPLINMGSSPEQVKKVMQNTGPYFMRKLSNDKKLCDLFKIEYSPDEKNAEKKTLKNRCKYTLQQILEDKDLHDDLKYQLIDLLLKIPYETKEDIIYCLDINKELLIRWISVDKDLYEANEIWKHNKESEKKNPNCITKKKRIKKSNEENNKELEMDKREAEIQANDISKLLDINTDFRQNLFIMIKSEFDKNPKSLSTVYKNLEMTRRDLKKVIKSEEKLVVVFNTWIRNILTEEFSTIPSKSINDIYKDTDLYKDELYGVVKNDTDWLLQDTYKNWRKDRLRLKAKARRKNKVLKVHDRNGVPTIDNKIELNVDLRNLEKLLKDILFIELENKELNKTLVDQGYERNDLLRQLLDKDPNVLSNLSNELNRILSV